MPFLTTPHGPEFDALKIGAIASEYYTPFSPNRQNDLRRNTPIWSCCLRTIKH